VNDRDHTLDPQQERARDAVRGLMEPVADATRVAELRARFVAGEAGGSHAPRATPRVRPARRIGQALTTLLATAAVVLLGVSLANRGPEWSLVELTGADHVILDGEVVAAADLVPGQLRPGRVVQVPEGGRLELVAGETLLFQLNDGVAVTLPRAPGRWFQRNIDGTVSGDGVLRVATGPAFPGARLAVHTDAADLMVTGTTFTVIHHVGSACICVLEGNVDACPPGTDSMEPVGAGKRRTFLRNGESTSSGNMLSREREELTQLRQRAPQLFQR